MISDVLFEAVEAIAEYRRDLPEVYGSMAEQLDALAAHMDRVRELLDTHPSPEWLGGKKPPAH